VLGVLQGPEPQVTQCGRVPCRCRKLGQIQDSPGGSESQSKLLTDTLGQCPLQLGGLGWQRQTPHIHISLVVSLIWTSQPASGTPSQTRHVPFLRCSHCYWLHPVVCSHHLTTFGGIAVSSPDKTDSSLFASRERR
jgi:hypothetical protein